MALTIDTILMTLISALINCCTFNETGKKYYKQDRYACKTCSFKDDEGVCSVCVRTCHSDHDVSYDGYLSHFCDCGAKGEELCNSLTKKQAGSTSVSRTGVRLGGPEAGPPTFRGRGRSGLTF